MNEGSSFHEVASGEDSPFRTFVLTSDIDWAPDYVLGDALDLFEDCGVAVTILATHATSVLSGLDGSKYEIGIHPNFNKLLFGEGGNPSAVVASLLEMFPDAVCVRSHCLAESRQILDIYSELGLKYDITQFLPYELTSRPYRFVNGLIRVPFNWADDYHYDSLKSFSSSGLDSNIKGVDIYNFHPIHLYLNTERAERYQEAKLLMQSGGHLGELRNRGPVPGARDLFTKLCRHNSGVANYAGCRPLTDVVDILLGDFE